MRGNFIRALTDEICAQEGCAEGTSDFSAVAQRHNRSQEGTGEEISYVYLRMKFALRKGVPKGLRTLVPSRSDYK